MKSAGVAGPFFISIGDAEKLNKFLDLNPKVPRDSAFVDGYDFTAYEAAGFGKLDGSDPDAAKGAKLAAPNLSMGDWFKYTTNVMALSPVPKDLKFGEIPEGVLRLGGTFVVDGNEVVYQWSDKIPGDYPAVDDVLQATKK
uniref:Uncharacterized protein n=1 Tax=Florenciella parvula TaxID=236787 RepID=A0A7S2CC10_9STRA|mmetsp:Transcript_27275/g.56071  ORF Transcript_27275/g.56071 Transcript_27275/m.56071 type:complete len:141 (+) Transcript_27275:392-814(+)